MAKICDNKSVGVVIKDEQGRILMIRRTKYPIAIAPIAGHLDGMTPEEALKTEALEEGGVRVLDYAWALSIKKENRCSRQGGDHHDWVVFEVLKFTGEPRENPDDPAKNPKWYSKEQIKALADLTFAYHNGLVSEKEWLENPGLEPIWIEFFRKLQIL